jgi:hypothetical protein
LCDIKLPSLNTIKKNFLKKNIPLEMDAFHGEDVWFSHVIVEFEYKGKKYHYDSTGVCKPATTTAMNEYPIMQGWLTAEEAMNLAYQPGWNEQFDRNEIPELVQKIDALLTSN